MLPVQTKVLTPQLTQCQVQTMLFTCYLSCDISYCAQNHFYVGPVSVRWNPCFLLDTYLGRRLLALVGSEDPRDALCVFSTLFKLVFI